MRERETHLGKPAQLSRIHPPLGPSPHPQIHGAGVGVAWVCAPALALISYTTNYLTLFPLVPLSIIRGFYSQGCCED